MSEDEARRTAGNEEPQDEVEAHRAHKNANDEGQTDGDDDVEAHRHLKNRPGKTA